MTYYTTSKDENPLIAEVKKQDLSLVSDEVSVLAQQALLIASFRHADACNSVIWSPNWQQVDGHHTFPTGFQFTVNENAPVYHNLFSEKQMYGVQMAFPLDAGANSSYYNKEKVDDKFFAKHHDQMSANIVNAISETDLAATSLSNFSGIFSTSQRTENGYEKKLYVVARYSNEKTSEKIMNKIKNATPQDDEQTIQYIHKLSSRSFNADPSYVGMACPHTTWRELFIADTDMATLRDEQVKHCASLMLKTIHACGLGAVVPGDKSTPSENIHAMLSNSQVVKTIFNDVDHIAPNGDLAYLSEMSSIHWATNGHVFRDTPKRGVTIFKTPTIRKTDGAPLIGLPCSTGQVCSIGTHSKKLTADNLPELAVKRPYIWDASATKNKHNTLMSQSLYRSTAGEEWRNISSLVGLNEASDNAIHLEPIIVRLAATPQPQIKK